MSVNKYEIRRQIDDAIDKLVKVQTNYPMYIEAGILSKKVVQLHSDLAYLHTLAVKIEAQKDVPKVTRGKTKQIY